MPKFSIGDHVIYKNILSAHEYENNYNPSVFPTFSLGYNGVVTHIYCFELTNMHLIRLDTFPFWLYEDAFERATIDITNDKQISLRILRELNE